MQIQDNNISCLRSTFNDFIILSLHAVEEPLEDGQHATALSIINHYMGQPDLNVSRAIIRAGKFSRKHAYTVIRLAHETSLKASCVAKAKL